MNIADNNIKDVGCSQLASAKWENLTLLLLSKIFIYAVRNGIDRSK